MNFKTFATSLVKEIGGKENVISLEHCATRLRFKLKDESLADSEAVKKIQGVINVVQRGGQYQVVVGNEVGQAYDAVMALLGLASMPKEEVKEEKKGNLLNRLIDLVTGIFVPILPVLIGAGMVRALLMLATTFFGLSEKSGTYLVFYEAYNAVYSFLPVYLAYTAAKKFNANPFVAVAVGVTLVSSTILNGIQSKAGMDLFGITMKAPTQGYGSSVIPIIIAIWFMSKVEHLCTKYIHPVCRNVLTPLICLSVTVPITFLAIGPLANGLQDALGQGYHALYSLNPLICGVIMGGAWQILVVFGLHWGIVPLCNINLSLYGFDTISGIIGPSNWAQAGAALGVALKSKNPDIKETAFSAAITGIFSITEPSIYGVNLKYKKPFYVAVVFSAIAGGIAGASASAALAAGPVGLLSFPLFLGKGFVGFVIAMGIAFIGSAIGTYIFGYDCKTFD